MKTIFLIAFSVVSVTLHAQNLRPHSIYAAYLGETVTHPGLKLGANYQLQYSGKNLSS